MKKARFAITIVRRGVEVERFIPNLDRRFREGVRLMVETMQEDARLWGNKLVVRRSTTQEREF